MNLDGFIPKPLFKNAKHVIQKKEWEFYKNNKENQ